MTQYVNRYVLDSANEQITYTCEVKRRSEEGDHFDVLSEIIYTADSDALQMAQNTFGPVVTAAYVDEDVTVRDHGLDTVTLNNVIVVLAGNYVLLTGSDEDGARFTKIEVENIAA